MPVSVPLGSPGLAGLEWTDAGLEESIRSGLDQVEVMLRESVLGEHEFITEASRHLVDAGGKRFRPLLALLAAEFGEPSARGVVESAVVVELTHLATLYHDDVMDEAALRRGAASANSRWGNTVAILTGDYLFARASEIIADLGPEAVRIQARTFGRLVSGQIRETVGAPPDADPIDHYLQVLDEKTGSLIATSALFGGMFAGVPAPVVEVLREYGDVIGIAFQLSDDLLDIASPGSESGKTPGTDLREGIRTLPVLLALRSAGAAAEDPASAAGGSATSARLAALLAGPVSEEDLPEALALLRGSPAMAEARAVLESYAERARTLLRSLPDVPARSALESLADFMLARTA